MSPDSVPALLAFAQTHHKAFEFVVGRRPRAVLDVPAGTGAFARRLREAGVNVSACDINSNDYQAEEVPFRAGDLTRRLPFDDNAFDVVTCLDGIEHLENPFHGIRELARLLAPGGALFLSVPNYLNIERRVKFLLTGSFTKPVSRDMFREKFGGCIHMMHLSPIGYPILKFALEHAGLEIACLDREKRKPRQCFFLPLALLIKAYTALWSEKTRRKWWLEETASREIFWGGNTLLIVAEKPAGP